MATDDDRATTAASDLLVERLIEAGALTGPDDPTREAKVRRFRSWLTSVTTSSPADDSLWARRLRGGFLRYITLSYDDEPEAPMDDAPEEEDDPES